MLNPLQGSQSQIEYNHLPYSMSSDDDDIDDIKAWSTKKSKNGKKTKIHAWTYHKSINTTIGTSFCLSDNPKIVKHGKRMLKCANFVAFAYESMSDGTKYKKSIAMVKMCKVRTCPVCQWRRSLQLAGEVGSKLRQVLNDNDNLTSFMVSLTVRNVNVKYLKSEIKLMYKAWKKLIERVVFAPVTHWVRSLEVTPGTRGVVGDAHPHIHAILVIDKSKMPKGWDTKKFWVKLWQDVAGLDYQPQVDIKPITGTGGAICEVLKYCVKPSKEALKCGWLEQVAIQLANVRLLGISKSLNDVVVDVDGVESAYIVVDSLPLGVVKLASTVIVLYKWYNQYKQYQRHDVIYQSLSEYKLNSYIDACISYNIVPKMLM